MMTERDAFLNTWDREFQTTLKVLKYFPADKGDYKPNDRLRAAKDLAWAFVAEVDVLATGVAAGKIEFDKMGAPPATLGEVITKLEKSHANAVAKVKAMPEAEWNSEMDFFVGPGKMGKLRKADLLWFMLYDMIHHRGQFTVYNRLIGAKVPSIYGPSADEPWM
jgi:uncharacterized damage-inducible protein DinB